MTELGGKTADEKKKKTRSGTLRRSKCRSNKGAKRKGGESNDNDREKTDPAPKTKRGTFPPSVKETKRDAHIQGQRQERKKEIT